MTRKEALKIVDEFIKNPGLKNHCLAVGAAMREYARKFGEDETAWEVTGILHDFDWEIHPNAEEHPSKGAENLGVDLDQHIQTVLTALQNSAVELGLSGEYS